MGDQLHRVQIKESARAPGTLAAGVSLRGAPSVSLCHHSHFCPLSLPLLVPCKDTCCHISGPLDDLG